MLEERTARRVTPAFFVLAIVCFFFTFAGVSCNTDQAKSALQNAASLSGGGLNLTELDRCLDALNGENLFSYSGLNLAFGTAPSALSSPPAACSPGAASLPSSSSVLPTGAQAKVGVQPMELAAFIAIFLGAVIGVIALLRPLPARWRALTSAVLAIVACALLLLEQAHAHTAIVDTIGSESAGAGVPFSLAQYINFNSGIAYLLALIALGIAVLYNAASGLFSVGRMSEVRPPPG